MARSLGYCADSQLFCCAGRPAASQVSQGRGSGGCKRRELGPVLSLGSSFVLGTAAAAVRMCGAGQGCALPAAHPVLMLGLP